MTPTGRTFESKRDGWVVVIVWLSAGVMVAAFTAQLRDSDTSAAGKGLLTVVVLAACVLLLWMLYGTRYVVGRESLWVVSGPLRYRIPLESIISVTPSHSPLSSPAFSMDRLRINYHGFRRRVLVSPENKREFLDALAAGAPHLRRESDRLVPADR